MPRWKLEIHELRSQQLAVLLYHHCSVCRETRAGSGDRSVCLCSLEVSSSFGTLGRLINHETFSMRNTWLSPYTRHIRAHCDYIVLKFAVRLWSGRVRVDAILGRKIKALLRTTSSINSRMHCQPATEFVVKHNSVSKYKAGLEVT